MENELDLQRVNQVCLPEWYSRINSVVLRPERPEYAIRMGVPPNEKWMRVLRRLQQVKLCADVQIDSHTVTEPLPLCQYLDRVWIHGVRDTYLKGALKFTAAILYDQECSGTVRDPKEQCLGNAEKAEEYCFQGEKCLDLICQTSQIIKPLFEHMLLIDYGIEQAEDSKLDAGFICDKWLSRRRDFDDLCDILMEWTQHFPFKHCYKIARCISLVKKQAASALRETATPASGKARARARRRFGGV